MSAIRLDILLVMVHFIIMLREVGRWYFPVAIYVAVGKFLELLSALIHMKSVDNTYN